MKFLLAFACVAVLVAVLAPSVTSAEDHGKPHPHIVLKRSSPPKWGGFEKAPNSPTYRRTVQIPHGEVHHSVDSQSHHISEGYVLKGKAAREEGPHRMGQPHSAEGPASTSKNPKKGKGH